MQNTITRKEIELQAKEYYDGLIDCELACYEAGMVSKVRLVSSLLAIKTEIIRLFGIKHDIVKNITKHINILLQIRG